MAEQKGLLIGLGVVAVAIGGYLLYRVIRKPKPKLTNAVVHYTSIGDETSANYIATELNIPIKHINTTSTADDILNQLMDYDVIITLGGSEANPIYRAAEAQGLVPELTTPGQKIIKSIQTAGKTIFLVAGSQATDTYAAAQDFVKQAR